MNRNELHPDLSREYQRDFGCGVVKVDHPKCQGMWFVVPPAPPLTPMSLEGVSAHLLAEAGEVIGRRPSLSQANELEALIAYLFLRKEAVESSRMEGTMSTMEHVLTPGEVLDDWKAKSEGASVRGYASALEKELQKTQADGLSIFDVDLVSRLHREMMGLDPMFRGIPGRIREPGTPAGIVWIRGKSHRPEDSLYNPPPASHVLRCLEEVMRWFSDSKFVALGNAGIGMPLVVRMAIGHAHFEGIHPFSDGNGRVGRMLLAIQMACHGKLPLYLSGYIEEEKTRYGEVLQAAQKKLNYIPIIDFFAEAVISASKESQITQAAIQSLPDLWKKRGSFRSGSAAVRALPWMLACPIFTIGQLQEKLAVSHQAANNAVSLLVKGKIVRERTGFERNRIFAAEEVIALLARKFGSDPEEALQGAQEILRGQGMG